MHNTHSRATHSVFRGLTRITERRPMRGQLRALALVAIMVTSLPVMFTGGAFSDGPGVVAADETDDGVSYDEDFEGGDDSDWEGVYEIQNEGFWNDYSIYQSDSLMTGEDDRVYWENGPTFDTGENFEISGTYKATADDARVRFGLENQGDGDDLFFAHSFEYDTIGISTDYGSAISDPSDDHVVDGAPDDVWLEFRIRLDGGTAQAKVWEAGTSEPVDWQMVNEFSQFEGEFFLSSGWSDNNRELWLDRIDAGGHTISGQVVDQNGDPVSNATVEAYGTDFDRLNETVDDLDAEAEELLDSIEQGVPEDFETFADDFAGGIDGSGEDLELEGERLDSDDLASEFDGTYPLVHEEGDWGVGTTTVVHSSVDAPRLTTDPDETVVISLWDPAEDGGWIDNQVDQSHPGATTEGEVVIEQLDPLGDGVQSRTVETEPEYETTGVNPLSTNEHHAVKTDLSEGVYRVYPEGAEERAYYFTVGDPADLAEQIIHDLENEAGQLTEYSQSIQNAITEGALGRTTTTTDEDGYYELHVQRGIERANVQAYRGDGTLLQDITGPSVSDLRDAADHGYNGTVYLTPLPERTDVPEDDVEIQVIRSDSPPFGDMENFEDLQEWLEEEYLDDAMAELDDGWDELVDEIDSDRLRQMTEDYRAIVDGDEELEDVIEDAIGRELDELDDLTDDDLREELEAIREELNNVEENIQLGDGEVEIGDDGLLEAIFPVPSWVDEDDVLLEYRDSSGEVNTIGEDYISLESDGLFGGQQVVVEDYPIDEGVGATDLRLEIYGDEGYGSSSGGATNPIFDGQLPEIDAVQFNTFAPAADGDRVAVELDADRSSVEGVTNVEVFDPNNEELDVDLEDDRATFQTGPAGDHMVRFTVESATGDEFTFSERIRAYDESRNYPATVRASESAATGTHAIVGERLESARVDTSDDGVAIDAIADRDDVPGEIHLHPEPVLGGDHHVLDFNVYQGSSEESVRSHVATFVHMDGGFEDGTLFYSNGNPATWDGDTRWGEVNERDDKHIYVTFTDERGSLEASINEDPGIIDRISHRIDRLIPTIPVIGSIVPAIPAPDAVVSPAAEPVIDAIPSGPNLAPAL